MASKIDITTIDRAVNALFKYEEKKASGKTQLIDGFAKPILVQVSLRFLLCITFLIVETGSTHKRGSTECTEAC